jgi:serine/threonine protein kinase
MYTWAHSQRQANILIDHRYSAQIADFGLVLLEECAIGGSTTTENAFNRRWASPQRIDGNRRELSDDIYSFGCMCYYVSVRGVCMYHSI